MKHDLYAAAVLLAFSVVSGNLDAQSYEWVRTGSGLGQDAGQRVATDAQGNVYMTGYFSGEAEFSGTLYEGNGIFDIFIAKYSPSGELLWLKFAGGTQNDTGYGIGVDSEGFIYITGYFTSIAAFGEGNPFRLTSSGSNDIFLAKYDADGNFIWAKKAGGQLEDRAQNLAIDRFDNIYITGYFSGRSYFDNETAIATGSTDAFIARYDTDGNCRWVQSLGGSGLDKAFGVATDISGYAYITGFFYYDAYLSNSPDTLHGDGLSSDIFICKYTPEGDVALAERAGGPYNDAAFAIAIDKDKAMLITGYFLEEIDFGDCHLQNYRYNDVFVVKYDSTFQCEWARHEGGDHLDMGLDIAVDKFGNVYVTGTYDSAASFGGRAVLSVNYYDIFICKYSGKGIMLWLQTAGGNGADLTKALCVKDDGVIYVTGYYKLTCKFGGISAPFSEEADIFLTKLSQPVGVEDILAETASFEIYPNPGAGDFVIELGDANLQQSSLVIADITGKVILRQDIAARDNRIPVEINVASGVYFVRVENRRNSFTRRVMVF